MTNDFIMVPDEVWEMKLKPKELISYMCHLLLEQESTSANTAIKAASLLSLKDWTATNQKLLELNMIKADPTKKRKTVLTDPSEWEVP